MSRGTGFACPKVRLRGTREIQRELSSERILNKACFIRFKEPAALLGVSAWPGSQVTWVCASAWATCSFRFAGQLPLSGRSGPRLRAARKVSLVLFAFWPYRSQIGSPTPRQWLRQRQRHLSGSVHKQSPSPRERRSVDEFSWLAVRHQRGSCGSDSVSSLRLSISGLSFSFSYSLSFASPLTSPSASPRL